MTIDFWNKQTPINGVAAEELLRDPFFANARSLFLVREGSIVTRIESVDVIRSNNKLDEMTDEQVAQWYIDEDSRLNEQSQMPIEHPNPDQY